MRESLQKVHCDGEGCRGAARPPPPAPHGPGFLSFTFPTVIASPWQSGCREQQLSEGIRATASVERVGGPAPQASVATRPTPGLWSPLPEATSPPIQALKEPNATPSPSSKLPPRLWSPAVLKPREGGYTATDRPPSAGTQHLGTHLEAPGGLV